MEIKLIITDFDGTLVNTFQANYHAYREAFEQMGLSLSEDTYRECYGLRFDGFMDKVGIVDDEVRRSIRSIKGECYPDYFGLLHVNQPLLDMIRIFRQGGGLTAVASTARGKNLNNALGHIGAKDDFDLILAGEDVKEGKPSPEIYNNVMQRMRVTPAETLIFEDSPVGLQAAQAAGAHYIKINL
ncbi:MAG: HAD family phosphatase [Muribaculaceae bacterium]|nr:HAD family phosphatase [Muribaculaceae bacterium]